MALGHNRLSILDLTESARQPMRLPGRDLWLVFNGEIYNFIELRNELISRGHEVISTGDSEVILHAYVEWGHECTRHFNGMWAFALWDGEKRELFCSRDRFGIKPLYYSHDHRRFVASSEIKGLLHVDSKLAEPNHAALYHFLARGLLDDTDATFYRNVKQLPPGHSALVNASGGLTVFPHYVPDAAILAVREDVRPSEAPDRLRALFEDAVRLRLRSDVPVGTCLSGGIDSSAIVGVASGLLGRGVASFTSMYPGTDSDESSFARLVAERFGTDAHWVEPAKGDFFEVLPRLTFHQDEPTSAPGLYSQWHVMQLAQGEVRVLLDGQGGDELFTGYLGHYADYVASLLRKAARGDLHAIGRLRREYPEIAAQAGRNPLVAGLLTRAPEWTRRVSRRLHHPPIVTKEYAQTWAPMEPSPRKPSALGDPLNSQLLDALTRTTIPSLLHYEDRNSMAFSIEARTPFLDYRLVEYALALPPELKIRGWETKAVLRDAMRDLLPPGVLARRDKKGYPTPLADWLRDGLMKTTRELLLSAESRARGIIDTAEVLRILDAHERGQADYHQQIWSLMTLEIWFRTFIDSGTPSRVVM